MKILNSTKTIMVKADKHYLAMTYLYNIRSSYHFLFYNCLFNRAYNIGAMGVAPSWGDIMKAFKYCNYDVDIKTYKLLFELNQKLSLGQK